MAGGGSEIVWIVPGKDCEDGNEGVEGEEEAEEGEEVGGKEPGGCEAGGWVERAGSTQRSCSCSFRRWNGAN